MTKPVGTNINVKLPASTPADARAVEKAVAASKPAIAQLADGVADKLTFDFTGVESKDLSSVASVLADSARQFDDFHAFFRHLQALGVEIAFDKKYTGPFIPRTKPVQFESPEIAKAYLPMAMRLQEVVSDTVRLSAFTPKTDGLSKEAQSLVSSGKLSQEGAEIWQRGKTLEGLANEIYPRFELLQEMLAGVDRSSDPDAKALLPAIIGALENLGDVHNRVFFAMTDYVEAAKTLRGSDLESPWPIFVRDAKSGDVAIEFRNTFRGEHLPPDVRQTKLNEAWAKFIDQKGGKVSDIVPITKSFLSGLDNGQLSEFVVTSDGQAMGTKNNKANHSLMAGTPDKSGKFTEKDVATAGALRMWRDESGEPALVILSAKSGHFRPTLKSLEAMKAVLVGMGVPADRILLSQGDVADSHITGAIQLWNYKLANDVDDVPRDWGSANIFDPLKDYEKTVRADARSEVAKLLPNEG